MLSFFSQCGADLPSQNWVEQHCDKLVCNTFDQKAQYKVQSKLWTLNTVSKLLLLQEYWLDLKGKNNKNNKKNI